MAGPAWLGTSLALIMIVTAGYCLTRLGLSWRRGRDTDRQVDAMHALMGAAMAVMLMPRVRLPWTGGWEVVFGATAAALAWRLGRGLRRRDGHRPGHDLQHLLGCAAMLYMLAAGGAIAARAADGMTAGSMAAAGGGESAAPALALAVALLACVVLTADRMSSLVPVRATGRGNITGTLGEAQNQPAPLSPRLAACCEIAMGLTMGYMLITML